MQALKQATVRSVQTLLTGNSIRLVCVLYGHRRVTKGPELKFELKTAAFRRPCLRLSPPCPAQSYTHPAFWSIPQLHHLSTPSGYFFSVFPIDRRFPARCCKYGSVGHLRNSLIFIRRWQASRPRRGE